MSTSSSTTKSPPAQAAKPDKTKKPSKIVVFKVSREYLRTLLPEPIPQKNSKAKSTPSSISTPTATPTAPATVPAPVSSPTAEASESNATPVPGATDVPVKKGSGAKAGTKRGIGQVDDGGSKSKRPAPKKKLKRDEGNIEPGAKASGGATNGTHKLGPKANQGVINAGLRALDRSGKPCRKWERKPIQLKSFTGVVWELPSWQAPKTKLPNDENHESKEASQPSGSKLNESSTAMNSEKSHTGENGVELKTESTPAAGSPLPAVLQPTIAATG